uniref:Putative secreted protein n=1 Tax=Anopheles triannulatus TaxID=58253 RepID=A0A2M4B2L8_9DIPT
MIKFRLLPCSTTCACATSSSGTDCGGTETIDRLPDDPVPMITPVLRDPEPEPLPPPRTVLLVRMILARERHWRDVGVLFELLFA